MTELSNAVTVLIARMESHPEDFELNEGELYSRAKFGDMVNGLYALTNVDSPVKNAFWYLNDADKQALADAWKKYNYTKLEKKVMERIFDDGAEEREAEVKRLQAQQRAHINAQMATIGTQAAQNSYAQNAMNAAQGSGNYYNGGLLGSAGTAIKGIFG